MDEGSISASMPPTMEQMLQRLASQFTVRDIMVPVERLTKAKTIEEAHKHLEAYADFNLIPIEEDSQITGYVERGSDERKLINLEVIMGNGCSILDLVDVLSDKQFCFVTGKCGIEGFVHFSDLNHSLVDLPLYILLQAVEACVASLIQSLFNKANLCEVLDGPNPGRAQNIIKQYERRKLNDANRSLLNEVSLKIMLEFASHFKLLDLTGYEICELSRVRDSLSHVPERLINNPNDVTRLKQTKDLCYKILNGRLST